MSINVNQYHLIDWYQRSISNRWCRILWVYRLPIDSATVDTLIVFNWYWFPITINQSYSLGSKGYLLTTPLSLLNTGQILDIALVVVIKWVWKDETFEQIENHQIWRVLSVPHRTLFLLSTFFMWLKYYFNQLNLPKAN